MAKFLLVIAVFIVFYLLLRNHARRQSTGYGQNPAPGREASGKASPKHGEDMVRCRVCGVHLPTSEAVTSRGEYYCGNEHLQIANRERSNR